MRRRAPRLGNHLVIDDLTGHKYRNDEMRFTWQGFLVHKDDWDPKHPQLDLRGRSEKISVPDARERQDDKFVTSVDPDSLNQQV